MNCEFLYLCVLSLWVQIRQEVAFVAAGSRSGESAAHSSDIANVKFKPDCNSQKDTNKKKQKNFSDIANVKFKPGCNYQKETSEKKIKKNSNVKFKPGCNATYFSQKETNKKNNKKNPLTLQMSSLRQTATPPIFSKETNKKTNKNNKKLLRHW